MEGKKKKRSRLLGVMMGKKLIREHKFLRGRIHLMH
jgi:hypothetical protein